MFIYIYICACICACICANMFLCTCVYLMCIYAYLYKLFMYAVRELQIGFQDVVFLPSRASFSTFLKNCGRCESLRTTTRLKSVVGVRYFCSNKASSCVNQILWRSKVCHKVEVNLSTLNFGDITRYKTVMSVCQCIFVYA